MLFTSVLSLKSQTVFYQDVCNCGVTGGGFSTGLGSGTGIFDIYIEQASQMYINIERELYEKLIKRLEEENDFLRRLTETRKVSSKRETRKE
jgi:hypothetical protein